MQIINTYSFKNGEKFLTKNNQQELEEIKHAINDLEAVSCLGKESKEKTMKGKLLFSPRNMNDQLKLVLHMKGWTENVLGKKKTFAEPRHYFGDGRFREMDGIKNKVGLEIQFGKYAFMGYDIFSKMVIFRNLGYILSGVEIVPSDELVKQMSTGVSSFSQLLVDFQNRGESNIDIPVLVLGIGLTKGEKKQCEEIQELFKNSRNEALKLIKIRRSKGSVPGPK